MINLTVFRVFLSIIFNVTGRIDYQIAQKNLFARSFRVKENQNKSYYFFFRFFLFVLKQQLKKSTHTENVEISKECFYDQSRDGYALRFDYLKCFLHREVKDSIYKEELLSSFSIPNFISLLFLFPPLLFLLIVKKNKGSVAIFFAEYIEITNLVRLLKKKSCKKIYFFTIYEVDSNFTYLILKKYNVYVHKITSEVPIHLWNSSILTDDLILCSAYQLDEIKHFKNSILYKSVQLWGPEHASLYNSLYRSNEDCEIEENSIGFYSTANWYRKQEDDVLDFIDADKYELQVLNTIKAVLLANPNLILKIYLHPKEKKTDQIGKAMLFYKNVLGDLKYEFVNLTSPTSLLFKTCNIAIAFNSTIVYERLYYGFKTLIMPIGYSDFPLDISNIKNICCYNSIELEKKIKESIHLTNKEFFEHNLINNYVLAD